MDRARSEAGTSLIEAVLALAILSVGSVSLLMSIDLSRSTASSQQSSARAISVLVSATDVVAGTPFVPCVPGDEAVAITAYRAALAGAGFTADQADVVAVSSWIWGDYGDAARCPDDDRQQRVTLRLGDRRTIDLVKRAGR